MNDETSDNENKQTKIQRSLKDSLIISFIFITATLVAKFALIDKIAECTSKHQAIASSGPCSTEAVCLLMALPVLIILFIFTIYYAGSAIKAIKKAPPMPDLLKQAVAIIIADILVATFMLISFILAVT